MDAQLRAAVIVLDDQTEPWMVCHPCWIGALLAFRKRGSPRALADFTLPEPKGRTFRKHTPAG